MTIRILNQKDNPLCAGYSVLSALQYLDKDIDVDAILPELNKTTMMTHMAAKNWFKAQGLIEDMVQIDDWQAKILLRKGEPIVTGATFVDWDKTNKAPYHLIWKEDQTGVTGHYWAVTHIVKEMYKITEVQCQNSWGEQWGNNGFFFMTLEDKRYKQKWKIIPKKKQEHNDIIREWTGKRVDNDGYPLNGKYQCQDWNRFYNNLRKRPITTYADAYDMYMKGLGDNWIKIEKAPLNYPQEGDVIFWGKSWGGGYGHVAIANKYCNPVLLRGSEQNGGRGSGTGLGDDAIRNFWRNYDGVVGWYRWIGK